jgi:hypothetical protein
MFDIVSKWLQVVGRQDAKSGLTSLEPNVMKQA